MERRRNQRMAVAIEVEIVHSLRPRGSFWTRNVGRDGLFLETPWLGIIPKDVVELQWHSGAAWAVVIHRSVRGLGLMFQNFSMETRLLAGREDDGLIARHGGYPDPHLVEALPSTRHVSPERTSHRRVT